MRKRAHEAALWRERRASWQPASRIFAVVSSEVYMIFLYYQYCMKST